jgi:hypothetical protein
MEKSIWAYAWDLADEELEPALAAMAERAGATDVNIAAAYHSGKFLHVHNPRRRVFFPTPGMLYFRPSDPRPGHGHISPPVWRGADGFWERLRPAASRAGLGVTAWIVCLHNSGVGLAHPDCAVENAYGDRIFTDLCPSNPDVRAYVTAMIREAAVQTGADRVLLESLEYMPFRHGYHHEVIGVPTGPTVDFLMSLCFCPHCATRAERGGFDLEAVRQWARALLDDHFSSPFRGREPLDWEQLRAGADGAMGSLLAMRRETLTTLLADVAGQVRKASDARLAILDFGPLYPNGPHDRGWENGVDLARQLPLVDEVHPTFYFDDGETHARKVAEYRDVLRGERPMIAALRAILPQTPSRERLEEQVEALRRDAAGFSFYNYGFMPLEVLDWIGGVVDGRRGG